jgi:hypothetical protein
MKPAPIKSVFRTFLIAASSASFQAVVFQAVVFQAVVVYSRNLNRN